MDVISELLKIRVEIGMPRKQLCQLADISRMTLSRLESGRKTSTDHAIVVRMADALGYEMELVLKSESSPH